jgi:hypothetical protein
MWAATVWSMALAACTAAESLEGTPRSMAQPMRRDIAHERLRSSTACSTSSATA